YPGASAEEVERQVTIPLELALAGMPGLQYTRSKSLFGLAHLRNQFDYGIDYDKAKQEVINRLQQALLPAGGTPPFPPASPTGEIPRYTLRNPVDTQPRPEDVAAVTAWSAAAFPANVPWAALYPSCQGREVYTLHDLKTLQDWTLQREFLRVPRIAC